MTSRNRVRPESDSEPRVFQGLTLSPFQVEAVEAIESGQNVLVSAPTGAGKTLVAEYAILETLKKGRRAIYTAPIKALSNQKYRDFKEILGSDVGIMTGDVTLSAEAPLLIMTTEIFRNTIFERPEDFDDVDYVIFDEIHYMDDPDRGTVWEESIIFAPEHIRFINLSATVSNLKQFGQWIEEVRDVEIRVIQCKERPVPLTHYFAHPKLGRKRADKTKYFPPISRRERVRSPARGLLDDLIRERQCPILFFCFSRRECEKRAMENRDRKLLKKAQVPKVLDLFDDICDLFEIASDETLSVLRDFASHGVGYHHAGLLPVHKELVERLFTSGLLKLLFTTETFALGINMPARTVIFSSLRKFDGVTFNPMLSREYQQMAGRAGRQGIDSEGLVFSIVDDGRIKAAEAKNVVFGEVEPIRSRFKLSYSTLINLHERLGERLFDAWRYSFNNFQWSRMGRKNRDKNESRQIRSIENRMTLLHEFGYINEEKVLRKGRIAQVINGFEIPSTELLCSGILEDLDEVQLNIVIASLVFEERRTDLFSKLPHEWLGDVRHEVEEIIGKIIHREMDLGIKPTVRFPNFKIGTVIERWTRGESFESLAEETTASQGDLVRTIRLTIQLIRQMRKADLEPSLDSRLRSGLVRMNRDVVDAKRQLELG